VSRQNNNNHNNGSMSRVGIVTASVLGFGVLISYGYLARNFKPEMYSGLGSNLFLPWLVSAILSAIGAILFVSIVFAVENSDDATMFGGRYNFVESRDTMILPFLIVFLLVSMLWSLFTVNAVRDARYRPAVQICLWLAAISAFALFVCSYNIETSQEWHRQVIIPSAAFLCFHCLTWDAQIWMTEFLYKPVTPASGHKLWTPMQYF
jgi:hypothetical protein